MFPRLRFSRHGLSSLGAPRVPQGPPVINPFIRPPCSSSPPPGPPSGAFQNPSISLPVKQFELPREPQITDVIGIIALPPLLRYCRVVWDADDQSNILSDLGSVGPKAQLSQMHTEFSLKQYAKRMEQPIYSAFHKQKKELVAGFLQTKHHGIIWGKNIWKQLRNTLLHSAPDINAYFMSFEYWELLNDFHNAEWIWRQWIQIFWKVYTRDIQKWRKKGKRGEKWPAMDLAECIGK